MHSFISSIGRVYPPGGTNCCVWRKILRVGLAIFVFLGMAGIAPAAQADDSIHVVARGESLGMIARKHNVSLRELIANNGISNPDIIYVGQRLVLPGSARTETTTDAEKSSAATITPATKSTLPDNHGYHVVGRGDTLSQIAKSNGIRLADLMNLNGITNSNFIWVGQKLRVTARVAPVASDKEAEPELATKIHVVKAGETLAKIADEFETTEQALLLSNGLPNAKFIWVGQRLRIQGRAAPPKTSPTQANAPADGYRWIEVNLSQQLLTAWQGNVPVLSTYISSGLAHTPTVTGRFSIGNKLPSQRMVGPDYDLPGVPYVMYFYGAYAIHGAYWHNNFGTPMSHGCVNMSVGDSAWLYNWAPMGTEVYVHY